MVAGSLPIRRGTKAWNQRTRRESWVSRVVRTAGLLREARFGLVIGLLEILFLVSPPRDPVLLMVLLMVDFDTWSPVAPSLEDPFTGIGRSLASPGLLLLCATSDFRWWRRDKPVYSMGFSTTWLCAAIRKRWWRTEMSL